MLLLPVWVFAQPATITKNGLTKQGVTVYSSGTLVVTGPIKTFVASTTISSNSDATVNLTTDGTATGTAIFSQILSLTPMAYINGTTANDAIVCTPKPIPADRKTVTVRYAKGASTGVIIGGTIPGHTNAVAGTATTITFLGL